MFLVAMVTLTIGELFVWPAVPTIANILAPKDKLGFYQGVVNSRGDCRENVRDRSLAEQLWIYTIWKYCL